MSLEAISEVIATKLNVSKNFARECAKTVFQALADQIWDKRTVNLKGFGTFRVVTLSGGQRRNPQTGETVDVPEREVIRFKMSRGLY